MALDEGSVKQLGQLPPLHRDPFDRMLICQAIEHNRAQVQAPDRPAGNRSSCRALLIGMTFLDSAPAPQRSRVLQSPSISLVPRLSLVPLAELNANHGAPKESAPQSLRDTSVPL